jgi:nucleoside-diphosphate-sugar epimerase
MTSLAVVTGATGMIGKRIVDMLLERGINVRILTRNQSYKNSKVEVVFGELSNSKICSQLLKNAEYVFHCAAELNNEEKMYQTNVEGTQQLMQNLDNDHVKYICYLSSVGVIGKFNGITADETTVCSPLNQYEITKLKAEVFVQNFKSSARVVILRPTNVIDKKKNALTDLSKAKIFLKGGEHAHIVHAEDVAAAAMYFLDHPASQNPDCYIVSYDNEQMNTVAGCLALCEAIKKKSSLEKTKPLPHLPWVVPYLIRRLSKGECNRSDVRYSPAKLLSTGFKYIRGFNGALREISENT